MEELIGIDGESGFGLLTRAQGTANDEVVVLFNAGLTHRAGPQRFHVDLARRLAAAGYHVFRFDLPGVGDAAMNNAVPAQAVVAKVFDVLEKATEARGFIVGGICSAADLGWRMAVSDERVRGLLLIDPMAAKGGWYRIGRWRMAMRSPLREWPAKLSRALRRRARDDEGEPVAMTEDYRDWPSLDEFGAQGRALLRRGVRILALYTGGVNDYMLHAGQLGRTYGGMRGHGDLRVEFHPELDHIFYAVRDRRAVIGLISGWLAPEAPASG